MSQSYLVKPVRTSAILTTGYVAGNVITVDMEAYPNRAPKNQLILNVDFTIGSLDYALLKLEFSDDGTNYYQEVSEGVSSGIITETLATRKLSATGKYSIPLPMKTKYLKVSAIGSGTVTNSLLAIDAVLCVA